MENGIGLLDAFIQALHGLFRWEDEQFNFAPRSLTFDLIHDWQCSFARADNQPTAFPRYLLFQRERCVPETVAELLGRLLLALPNFPSVDHDVIAVVSAIDSNLSK